MDFVDLKNKNIEELKQLLAELSDELRSLNFKAKGGQLKQVHKIKNVKKGIARVQFLIGSKKSILK